MGKHQLKFKFVRVERYGRSYWKSQFSVDCFEYTNPSLTFVIIELLSMYMSNSGKNRSHYYDMVYKTIRRYIDHV